MADDYSITLGAWFDLVRRARLPVQLNEAALTVGSYADADGTGIYCGTARLSVDLDCSYSTAKRRLAELRRIRLVERTKRVRLRGWSDEYRLILDPALLEHVEVPSPEKYRLMAVDIRDRTRLGRKSVQLTHGDQYAKPVQLKSEPVQLTHGDPPPTSTHLPDHDQPSITSKTILPTVALVSAPANDDGMALEEEDHREFNGTCSACGVLYDPGRVCGNRTCTDYQRTSP